MPNKTDYQKVHDLLTELGVPIVVTISRFISTDIDQAPTSSKLDGYHGFYTDFEFDSEGKFISMGAWE